jgi:glycosyltransferase involved in cell wall biosynthesis
MHLRALLAQLPDRIRPVVAIPDSPPDWLTDMPVEIHPTQSTSSGKLKWEQRVLPRLDRKLHAGLLHLTSAHPPLFGPGNCLISPAGFGGFEALSDSKAAGAVRSLSERIREAMGSGGLARVPGVIWPSDLPVPDLPAPLFQIPPTVHPDFYKGALKANDRISGNGDGSKRGLAQVDLPETYILYHGPDDPVSLSNLAETWSRAAGSIGEYYPLLLLGLETKAWQTLEKLLEGTGIAGTIRRVPAVSPEHIPGLYRECTALLHPAPPAPWGGPIRHALAAGKPVVSIEGKQVDAMVGPAAYLVPPGDPRALAAALITVVVEETVAGNLAGQAAQRAARWHSSDFSSELVKTYEKTLSNQAG